MTRTSFLLHALPLLCATALLPAQENPFPLYKHRPYLQSLTSTSVMIVTQSKEKVVARVRFGLPPNMTSVLEEDSPRNDHVFRLEGLKPDTAYGYQVTHVGVETFARFEFRTLPEADSGVEVNVAVIGDSGTLSDGQLGIASILEELAPALLIHTGDTVYPFGTHFNYYERFFQVYKTLLATTCIYPSLGNHDCIKGPEYWLYMFYLPANNPKNDESYYSFDAGDAHFAALNSCTTDDDNPLGIPEEQIQWLEDDLARSTRTWKLVYFHHGPYSNSLHGGNLGVRQTLVPVLERQHVDLVLTGHDHVYERSYPVLQGFAVDGFQEPDYVSPRGILYLVSGGGGGSLYEYSPGPDVNLSAVFHSKHHTVHLKITHDEIDGEVIGLGKEVLDRFTIRKQGQPPALSFLRGDANGDGKADLTDVIRILNFLFTGGPSPCLGASDVNGSGDIVLTDPIHLLNFLFKGGPAPDPPFPDCGVADGADDRGCTRSCRT